MAQLNAAQTPAAATHRVIPRILPPLRVEEKYSRKKAAKMLNMEMDLRVNQEASERQRNKAKYKHPHQLLNAQSERERMKRFNSLPNGLLDIRKKNSVANMGGIFPKGSDGEILRLLSLRGPLETVRDPRKSPVPKPQVQRKITNKSENAAMASPGIDINLESESRSNMLRSSMESVNSKCKQPVESEAHQGTTRRRIPSTRYKRKKGRMGSKFKRLSHFLSILFGLWKIHAARVKNFLDTNVDLMEYHEPVELMFDVTIFKADKQGALSQETKRILMKKPELRTEQEVKHVQVALRNYPTIAEYPIQMTKEMAQRSWLERFDQKRIIIQQSHPAMCFYIILSGSVIVSRMDSEYSVSRTVCFLNRGESFGELGLISNAPRQATVISKEPVELLVFSDEDYVDIFMGGGLKGVSDPFLSNLWCFEDWPTEIIPKHPTDAFLSYFKRNTVLVPNSKYSEWIYIVKSGSCTVLKKLHEVPPTTRKKERATGDAQQEHKRKMRKSETVLQAKTSLRSTFYRRKELHELKLGIETKPINDEPGLMDYISLMSAFNTSKKSKSTLCNVAEKDENKENRDFSELAKTEDSTEESTVADSVQAKQQESVHSDTIEHSDESNEQQEIQENADQKALLKAKKAVVIKKTSLSSKGPFLSKTPFEDTPTIQEEPSTAENSNIKELQLESITEVDQSVSEEKTVRMQDEEPATDQSHNAAGHIGAEDEEDLRTVLNEKPKEFKQEKKTIMDEINKNAMSTSGFVSVEDKEPMFVRVQTLTKGAVFGMADLVHYDQPAMSLISNGAECMLIKKKFYTDHASQHLLNKVRHETSPYPTQPEMQASLQEYVDWVNQKEKTIRQTLHNNKLSKMSVHDARSSLHLQQEKNIRDYAIKLAGPLHG